MPGLGRARRLKWAKSRVRPLLPLFVKNSVIRLTNILGLLGSTLFVTFQYDATCSRP